MAKVIINNNLEKAINKKFKGESVEIFELIYSLEENPKKGKVVGQIGGVVIKELKYGKFRFYFVADGYKIKFLDITDLHDLLIRFVRMSDKKTQQKIIDEVKSILKKFGEEGFD
ncbi:MAG: hypothetical protein KKC19_03385 [Nanoarchaeota archaeon]|nr:hypothetical protein [Nanoarchaeota archaeon]